MYVCTYVCPGGILSTCTMYIHTDKYLHSYARGAETLSTELIHIHECVYVSVYTNTRPYTFICAWCCKDLHASIYTNTHINILHIYRFTDTHTYIHNVPITCVPPVNIKKKLSKHTHIHKCIYIYMYTYIDVYIPVCPWCLTRAPKIVFVCFLRRAKTHTYMYIHTYLRVCPWCFTCATTNMLVCFLRGIEWALQTPPTKVLGTPTSYDVYVSMYVCVYIALWVVLGGLL
jgi:hypothetical protein